MWLLLVVLLAPLGSTTGYYSPPPPAHALATCFQHNTSVHLDCRATQVPGHIHVVKVIYDYVSEDNGGCSDNNNPTSCHATGTDWPNVRLCELKTSCDVDVSPFELRCGAMTNFIFIQYICLEGPPDRILCALGSVCDYNDRWRLVLPDNWVWDEGGQANISEVSSIVTTPTTPIRSVINWTESYVADWDYEVDYEWPESDHENTDEDDRRRRSIRQTSGNSAASHGGRHLKQVEEASDPSRRQRRAVTTESIVSSYIASDPPVVRVVTPNYPNNYSNRLDGACHVQTVAGSRLYLTVQRFHLELHGLCEWDWLHIETDLHSMKLCDTILPGSTKDLGTTWAKALFHSDILYNDTGFLISFTALTQNNVNSPVAIWCAKETALEWYLDSNPPDLALMEYIAVSNGFSFNVTSRQEVVIGGLDASTLAEIVTIVAVGFVLVVLFVALIVYVRKRTKRLSSTASEGAPTTSTTSAAPMPPAYTPYFGGDAEGAATDAGLPPKGLQLENPGYEEVPEKVIRVFENVECDLGPESDGKSVDRVPLHPV